MCLVWTINVFCENCVPRLKALKYKGNPKETKFIIIIIILLMIIVMRSRYVWQWAHLVSMQRTDLARTPQLPDAPLVHSSLLSYITMMMRPTGYICFNFSPVCIFKRLPKLIWYDSLFRISCVAPAQQAYHYLRMPPCVLILSRACRVKINSDTSRQEFGLGRLL